MAYEITFFYHEKGEDGRFDMDTVKSFTRRIGSKTDEVPLEKVAATVLGQLAKRTIYISDVKVFEFVKKEITYKETNSGIVIKGKKFPFDQLAAELTCTAEERPQQQQEEVEEAPSDSVEQPLVDMATGLTINPTPQIPKNLGPKIKPRESNTPIRYEVFRPCREDYMDCQRQGMKLSMGRNYPIFHESVRSISGPYGPAETVFYKVQDDSGQKIDVINTFFEPIPRGLSFTGVVGAVPRPPEGRLSYADAPLAASIGGGGGGRIDALVAAQDAALMRRG